MLHSFTLCNTKKNVSHDLALFVFFHYLVFIHFLILVLTFRTPLTPKYDVHSNKFHTGGSCRKNKTLSNNLVDIHIQVLYIYWCIILFADNIPLLNDHSGRHTYTSTVYILVYYIFADKTPLLNESLQRVVDLFLAWRMFTVVMRHFWMKDR